VLKYYFFVEKVSVWIYSNYCKSIQRLMIPLNSHITRQVLSYFFLHPEAEMYINEIARRLDLDSGNLTRKLKEIEVEGILKSEQRGNQRYYMINSDYPLIEQYKKIILSTVGIEALLKKMLKSVSGVKSAFLYGSYAKNSMNAGSDIDLFVVGEHNTLALQKQIAIIQKTTDREINLFSIGIDEFDKRKESDSFIKSVMESKKIVLL
jgi:predicted nucleotidyltransferase